MASCFIFFTLSLFLCTSTVTNDDGETTAEARRHQSLPPLASHLLHLHPGNLLTALRILGLVQIQTSAIDPGASSQASNEL